MCVCVVLRLCGPVGQRGGRGFGATRASILLNVIFRYYECGLRGASAVFTPTCILVNLYILCTIIVS